MLGSQKVVLLGSSGQPVGIGSVAGGNMLHGQLVPAGYTKVVIEYAQPGTVPMLSTNFDGKELCTGQFTAWATDCIMYIIMTVTDSAICVNCYTMSGL